MADRMSGTYVGHCDCQLVCPCAFDGPPTGRDGQCPGLLVFGIETGSLDDTDLSGVNVAMGYMAPSNISAGDLKLGIVVDEGASDEQADALGRILEGGVFGEFVPLVGEWLGVERAPVSFSDGDEPSAKTGDTTSRSRRSRARMASRRRRAMPHLASRRYSGSASRPGPRAFSASRLRPVTASRPQSSSTRRRSARGPLESATLKRAPPLPELIRLGLIGILLLLAAVAWLVTDERMAGMNMGPGTDPGTLGFWVTAWVVMMGAMMFPSIAPMVLMYARIQEGKRAKGQAPPAGATAVFVAGYLLTWSVAGLAGYSILRLGHELSPGFLAWDEAGRYLAGAVILAAAIYQLTPLKDLCLSKCRSPFAFLLTAWKPGRTGALRMGIEHGGWCVGCCWALMAALIALGVMSVGWMVFVAALIATEKLLPSKAVVNRSIAVLLAVLGLAVALVPEHVPGLTVPSEAMGADMQGGSMDEPAMDR